MHILLFSHDKTLFKKDSESQRRMRERGKICSSLVIMVPTQEGFSEERLALNVRAIPTNSKSRFWSFWDLRRMGREIIRSSFRPPRPGQQGGASRNPESWIPDQVRDDNYLIIAQDPFEFGWIATKLGKKYDIPVQVELHGDFYSTGYWRWSGPGNFVRHMIGAWVLRRAGSIRAVSERVRASLREKLGIADSRISVFPVETDTRRYLDAPRSSFLKERYGNFDFFLLTVGALNPVKNVGMQIRALHDVVKHYPKTALVVVGDGQERKLLEIAAHKLRVSQNVIFTGTQQDLMPYYMSTDVFLFTSRAEGWGRVAVEAMASGLPVVMTDVGLAGEFLINGKNGIVVARKDEKVLVHAIGELRRDAGLRERLGREARKTVAVLPSHEEVLRKYKESWEQCLTVSRG